MINELDKRIKEKQSLNSDIQKHIKELQGALESKNAGKSPSLLAKQRAIALDALSRTVPFHGEDETCAQSMSKTHLQNEISALERIHHDLTSSKRYYEESLELQKILHNHLVQMSKLLTKRIDKESAKLDELEDTGPESTVQSISTKLQLEVQREAQIMDRLKKVLEMISEEHSSVQASAEEVNLQNLQIVQALLNGLMTRENQGYLSIQELGGLNPLLRQLLKANIVSTNLDMTEIRLNSYGLDEELLLIV